MVRFELDKELRMMLFRLVIKSKREKKNSESPWGIFFTELKTQHLYYFYQKHYAIDIVDPSSMQDACYKNFLIDLAHRRVFVAQW